MSLQQLIARWLAAQAMQAVKQEIFSPSEAEPPKDDKPRRLSCDDAQAPGPEPAMPETDIGFVFAMPMEAAGVVDLLKDRKRTRGDGRVFHTGRFAGYRAAIVESGVGREKAGRATEVLIDVFRPKRIISAGYGGALNKRLKRFAVCFPEIVRRESDGRALDLSTSIPRLAPDTGTSTANKLVLLTTDFVVATPKRKAELGRQTGAELVDMETFAVAEVCRRRGVPLLAVRIILDTAEEQLPGDVQRILRSAEKGGARLAGSVLGSLFQRPSSMIDLFSLKQRALSATDKLARRLTAELSPE